MGFLDALTGGHNNDAQAALDRAWQSFAGIGVPSIEQLTLPELEKYVQSGLVTPAQAQAVLQAKNAMDTVKSDPTATSAEVSALKQLQGVADSKGMDATEQAKLGQTESTLNQTLQGQRGSILDQMAARGIPTSLMGTAAELGAAGQDAQQAHADALQANSDAEQRALAAMAQSGQLGGQIESQNFGEQYVKAQSQNAIDQWNAANQTNVNLANQQAQQQANIYNQQNAQGVSNANVQAANQRTQYNAALPQTQYKDKIQKADGQAGISEAQANAQTQAGQQNAGLIGAGLGAVGTIAGGMMGGPVGAAAGGAAAGAATNNNNSYAGALARGGEIGGMPRVPGDSPANDTKIAAVSPGEVVLPRTVSHSPNLAAEFVRHLHKAPTSTRPAVHPDDVKSVFHALTAMRGGF